MIERVYHSARCQCGSYLFNGSTAERWLGGWRHCVACRPRNENVIGHKNRCAPTPRG